jgi:two-component system, chemotaxis family, sensor kinase CheA
VNIDLTRFSAAFFEESAEHVASLEQGLLSLERTPGDAELLNAIFRAAHSIKGGSSTFGFSDVARFTHTLEGLLDEVRSGQRPLDGPLNGLLLRATDALRSLLACAKAGTPAPPESQEVLAELVRCCGTRPAPSPASGPVVEQARTRRMRIRFTPAPDLFLCGGDPLLVLRELATLGTVVEARCDTSKLAPLEELNPDLCALSFSLALETACSDAELRDVFCFIEDGATISIAPDDGREATVPLPAAAPALVAPAPAALAPAAPAASASSDGRPRAPDGTPIERRAGEASSIRVAAEKVDKLVDLVGEMAITQSMLTQALSDPSPAGRMRLKEAVAQMERNTREMQERVMAVRMVPVGTVLGRFHRVVRDLAAQLGKQLTLDIRGEDVELDRGVVERISDPLTHLVRNAIDHGIETPEERRAKGKPETGTLHLWAHQQGSHVIIEAADDGRGLDVARIRAKAIASGLIAADAVLTDEQVHALIFAPGFSTKEQVTDVSGRGVGMDVVKRNIEALNGSVALTANPGAGTTCTIRLPLTMAILDGLVLRVGDRHFVLPLLSIFESFRPRREDVRTVLGRGEVVMLRGEAIPLVRLHRVFGVEADHTDPSDGLVTLVDSGGVRVALLVDELLGQAQVVAKSLEKNYRRVDGISGATILGDGRIALMLDVLFLARRRPEAA